MIDSWGASPTAVVAARASRGLQKCMARFDCDRWRSQAGISVILAARARETKEGGASQEMVGASSGATPRAWGRHLPLGPQSSGRTSPAARRRPFAPHVRCRRHGGSSHHILRMCGLLGTSYHGRRMLAHRRTAVRVPSGTPSSGSEQNTSALLQTPLASKIRSDAAVGVRERRWAALPASRLVHAAWSVVMSARRGVTSRDRRKLSGALDRSSLVEDGAQALVEGAVQGPDPRGHGVATRKRRFRRVGLEGMREFVVWCAMGVQNTEPRRSAGTCRVPCATLPDLVIVSQWAGGGTKTNLCVSARLGKPIHSDRHLWRKVSIRVPRPMPHPNRYATLVIAARWALTPPAFLEFPCH